MDTFVKKLRGTSSNQNLPIYENIVPKEWIKSITSPCRLQFNLASSIRYNNFKIKAKILVPSDSPCFSTSNRYTILSTRGAQIMLLLREGTLLVQISGVESIVEAQILPDTEYNVIVDSSSNTISINDTISTFQNTWSTAAVETTNMFGSSPVNTVFYGNIEFGKGGEAAASYSFDPIKFNGVSCLKDSVNNTYKYADSGELLAFNL